MTNDPIEVDPQHYSVELENDQVRVLRVKYLPGTKSTMHYHPNSVAVVVSNGKVRFTFPDGRVRERDVKAGDVHFNPAGEHCPENIGTTPLEVLLIELKR